MKTQLQKIFVLLVKREQLTSHTERKKKKWKEKEIKTHIRKWSKTPEEQEEGPCDMNGVSSITILMMELPPLMADDAVALRPIFCGIVETY